MTIKFKSLNPSLFNVVMDNPSVQVCLKTSGHKFFLKFDTKDVLHKMSYSGPIDPWLESLCHISLGKNLSELSHLNLKNWDDVFAADQVYWDLKVEKADQFFFTALELLKAALDSYRGREYLYQEPEALICRCFGVRENDVMAYIRTTDDPTPEGLAAVTKAGMGCRSCVPQLTKWLSINKPKTQNHFFKEKPRAHWLLEIDYMLSCFPEASEWNMEVKSFQGTQVSILFKKDATQREEEEMTVKLQDFLGAALDSDLSFFLIRA